MKKALFISLLLVSAFLIGSSAALAQCTNYQDYECTIIETHYGQVDDMFSDCLELCYDDGFEVDFNDFAGIDCIEGYLYPAPDNKHLLGTGYSYCDNSWAGCSVEFKGKTVTVKCSWIEGLVEGYGFVDKSTCTPCNDCWGQSHC
jgi:hypothetical protein